MCILHVDQNRLFLVRHVTEMYTVEKGERLVTLVRTFCTEVIPLFTSARHYFYRSAVPPPRLTTCLDCIRDIHISPVHRVRVVPSA